MYLIDCSIFIFSTGTEQKKFPLLIISFLDQRSCTKTVIGIQIVFTTPRNITQSRVADRQRISAKYFSKSMSKGSSFGIYKGI
jgi:hypothetical protein